MDALCFFGAEHQHAQAHKLPGKGEAGILKTMSRVLALHSTQSTSNTS